MRQADKKDRDTIVDILLKSFENNKSVNYIIKQDVKREVRLRRLMEYSFDSCMLYGDVFITDDKAGCALVVKPDKKKTLPKTILLDAIVAVRALGLSNLKTAMRRESIIKSHHPRELLYYLWFIGVDPEKQGRGIGSKLLGDVITEATKDNRILCLETSTIKNIPWYQSFGFSIYHELDFGYKLFLLEKRLTTDLS